MEVVEGDEPELVDASEAGEEGRSGASGGVVEYGPVLRPPPGLPLIVRHREFGGFERSMDSSCEGFHHQYHHPSIHVDGWHVVWSPEKPSVDPEQDRQFCAAAFHGCVRCVSHFMRDFKMDPTIAIFAMSPYDCALHGYERGGWMYVDRSGCWQVVQMIEAQYPGARQGLRMAALS